MIKITGTFTVKNEKGWHARPCSRIVKLIKSYPNITVVLEKTNCASIGAAGNSIFEVMKLGVNYGDEIAYTLQGENKFEMHLLVKELLALNELLAKEESNDSYDFV